MKRLFLSVFAAALTAACIVPTVATATDFTFSGQYRLRGEMRDNADFNNAVNDSTDFWDQRVRLTTNAKVSDDTSVKITLQDSRRWGAATNTSPNLNGPALTDSGSNTVDLHESYVNIDNLFGAPVSLKAGRQELVYGDERLIGAFGWNNNGRSFDALKVAYTSDMVNVDLWTSKVLEGTNNISNSDQDFSGAYATVKAIPNNTLDVYALWLRDASTNGPIVKTNTTITAASITKAQNLYTIGARLKGAIAGVDYTLEVPFQTGKIDTNSTVGKYKISAMAAAAKAGYTLPVPMNVRVGAEFDYASGDKNGGDNKIQTFSNLFPTNHDKLGYMDQQAWRNVKAYNLNASIEPLEKLKVLVSVWDLNLDKKEDNWYLAANWMNAPTTTLRTGTISGNSTKNKHIGDEFDLVATYKYSNAVTAELGYGYFQGGAYIKDKIDATAGSSKANQDWEYLMLTTNF